MARCCPAYGRNCSARGIHLRAPHHAPCGLKGDQCAEARWAAAAPRALPDGPNGGAPGDQEPGYTTSIALLERQQSHAQASPRNVSASASVSPGVTPPTPPDDTAAATATAYLQLLLVPILWGTYNPCIRYLYNEPNPLDAATLTAVRTTLSAGILMLAAAVQEGSQAWARRGNAVLSAQQGAASSEPGATSGLAVQQQQQQQQPGVVPINSKRLGPLLTRGFDNVVFAGLELGILNFLGTALQLTSLVTPLVSYLAGYDIPPAVGAAVLLGIAGSSLVAYDGIQMRHAAAVATDGAVADSFLLSGGEVQLLLSCLFFSTGTVRMGLYAPRMKAINLTTVKKMGLSGSSMLWLWWSNLQHGVPLASGFQFPDLSARPPQSLAILVYSAWGPGSLAAFLQVSGQRMVPATQAQVIFSLTPLWSALFANLTLGGETMGPIAWFGGGMIVVAGLIAARAQQQQQQQQQQLAKAAPASASSAVCE